MKIVQAGDVTFRKAYKINSVSNQDNSKLYEIEFSDGMIWAVGLNENQLETDYASVIHSVYARL